MPTKLVPPNTFFSHIHTIESYTDVADDDCILYQRRLLDWGRAFVHGHTFLHSWSGPMTSVVGLLHGATFLSNFPLVLFLSFIGPYSSWKGHLLNPLIIIIIIIPSASWPLSFLSLFLFLRPCLIHARMPDRGRVFVHGHTFLHSWTHFLAFMEWADDGCSGPATWSYVPVKSSSCSLRVFYRTFVVGKDTH